MFKRILCLVFALALLVAGPSPSPADTRLPEKVLDDLLKAGNLRPTIMVDGKTHHARLDRNYQIVWGLPTDVPGNDWKNTETCWQTETTFNVGKPNQEPRYLGYTHLGALFSNAWFPDDAPHLTAPADRKLIERPWKEGHTRGGDNTGVSEDSWRIIIAALAEHHKTVGFPDDKAFPLNPLFNNKFDQQTLSRYFKVLAEPRPGVAGAVRHWHHREDLGGVFYMTIVIEWQPIPDFIVVDLKDDANLSFLDPGTELAKPGETYRGKLSIVGLLLDNSYLEDPVNRQMYDLVYSRHEPLPRYLIPFGIAVDGRLISLQGHSAVPGTQSAYLTTIGSGTRSQEVVEVEFDWRLPDGYDKPEIILEAQVNWADELLSGPGVAGPVYRHEVYKEWFKGNNYTKVTVPTNIVRPDFSVELIPNRFEGQNGQALSGTVRYALNEDHPQAETAVLRLHHVAGAEHAINLQPVSPADAPDAEGRVTFQPGDVKEYRYSFTVQAASEMILARINPVQGQDKDWSNNRAEAPIGRPCTDIRVSLTPHPPGVRGTGDNTQLTAVVTRGRDGPAGPVSVRFKFGHGSWQNFTLAQGQSRTFQDVVTHSRAGNATYSAEAWPVGIEDCNPANNRASVTIPVQARPEYAAPDSPMSVERISGGDWKFNRN